MKNNLAQIVVFVIEKFIIDSTFYILVKSILEVKLSFSEDQKKRVSILDLPGDILIVPQVWLEMRWTKMSPLRFIYLLI